MVRASTGAVMPCGVASAGAVEQVGAAGITGPYVLTLDAPVAQWCALAAPVVAQAADTEVAVQVVATAAVIIIGNR